MPVTITLNMIRAHGPCKDGWEKVLRGQGKTIADDVPFPIADILESNDLLDTIWVLRCLPDSTIAVEFAKGCTTRAADAARAAARAADAARAAVRATRATRATRAADAAADAAAYAAADAAADAADTAADAADAADTAAARAADGEHDKQKQHLLELFNK